ncbi:MAG: gluconokinase, partial [Devosia sp.]
MPLIPSRIIIVMGVSSSGKSTVGQSIARRLHVPFLDGDGYHPEANVEKMRAGTPLTDEDRWPWLERLAGALHEAADR